MESLEGHIVDQPDLALEGGDEGNGFSGAPAVRRVDQWLEGSGVGDGDVVDAEGGGFKEGGGGCDELVDGDTCGPAFFYTAESAEDGEGVGTLGGIEPGVAAAHGEAVRFAQGRAAMEGGGKAHDRKEALHNHALLIVFAAHEQVVGPDDVEQAVHDLGYALEVAGPVFAFQNGLQGTKIVFFEPGSPAGVDGGDVWKEKGVCSGFFKQGDVFFEGDGVFGKVCRVVELGRVDEDAADR